MFSDEKKFNLYGPNSSQCYWHDLRKKQLFSKRPSGGGSVKVLGAFSATGKADLVVIEGKQKSALYINVLEEGLFPFMNRLDTKIHFSTEQQTSMLSKDWFKTKNIEVLD